MKKIVHVPQAASPLGAYQHGILSRGFLFVSGQLALNSSGKLFVGPIEEETRLAMENVSKILAAADMDFSDVVKCTIYVTDIKDFSSVNKIYQSFFAGEYPARETVQVSALPAGGNVEVSCIASRD